ncbi:prolyl 4-hydroxylase subunit alpha-2-like [Drosophila biarmipes]|uniref:prolyl 4-hydroxylase subunit alpha-2-like n=1 Tax=Drosophila biarmipes TaxID=125945 RepID=UPI0007E5EFE7|nr:prolyl 4-hydroxylase subunit alpha-2-like [Drosophila biarmipes]
MALKIKEWVRLPGYLLAALILGSVVVGKPPVEKSHSLSLVTMVPLLELERKLIDILENYTNAVEEKLQAVRSQIPLMRSENEKGKQDAISYLSNPLNSFSLIRRLHVDWFQWRKFMEQPVGIPQMQNLDSWLQELPTKTDLWEACTGVARIQRTYNLKISDFIEGRINGKQYNASMSCGDIFAVGHHLAQENKTSEAIQWLQEVSPLLQEDLLIIPKHLAIEEFEVLKLLAETHFREEHYSKALTLLDNCLKMKPQDAHVLRLRRKTKDLLENQPVPTLEETKQKEVPDTYKIGCRGMFKKPTRLHCFYNFTTTPFLRLAPLKTEQVGLNPYVVLYHDMLSAQEISVLIDKAAQNMKNARTHTLYPTNKSRGRTAKAHWFNKENNKLTRRITRRIQDMTGFDLTDSEELQVINYGIGGHYYTHSDYFNFASANYTRKLTTQAAILGDRIATVLFYLTDVEQGGATIFVNVGYSVYPRAGTAIFWYNLDADGNGDPLTRHAACPVIVGSKWVMTEWIRERRQIFIRPCLPRSKEPSPKS